jgi:serine/threonine protein phosphatase PrpC
MQIKAWGRTDVGCVRQNNEDHFLCDDSLGLYVVCDGMGGHAAGEVASAMACQMLRDKVLELAGTYLHRNKPTTSATRVALTQAMQRGMQAISDAIHQAGNQGNQQRGMGTTCTALWVVDSQHALVAHVGDSRLYLRTEAGCERVTHDHTLVEELVARGLLSAQDARRHPQSHILARALGASTGLAADCFFLAIAPHDAFLICSDGLHAYLPDEQTLAHRLGEHVLGTVGDALINEAKSQGGHDNLTAVLVRLEPDVAQPEAGAMSPLWHAVHQALPELTPCQTRRLLAATDRFAGFTESTDVASWQQGGLFLVAQGSLTLRPSEGSPTTVKVGQPTLVEPGGSGARLGVTPSPACVVAHASAATLRAVLGHDPELGARLLRQLFTAVPRSEAPATR